MKPITLMLIIALTACGGSGSGAPSSQQGTTAVGQPGKIETNKGPQP